MKCKSNHSEISPHICISIAIIRNTRINKCCWEHVEKVSLVPYGWEWELVRALWKTEGRFLTKWKPKTNVIQWLYFWVFIQREQRNKLIKTPSPHIHCSISYNNEDIETTSVSTEWWIDKREYGIHIDWNIIQP